MINRFILSVSRYDKAALRVVEVLFAKPPGRFRTPDTAQPEYVYYGVDTKTADRGRWHSHREKKF